MSNALLIVDMQKTWINPNKQMFPSSEMVIKNIQKLRAAFKAKNDPVFHLIIEHKSDGTDARKNGKLFNISDSKEAEIIDDLKPDVGEFVIKKTRLSGFHGTTLLEQLKKLNVTGVAVTGLELRACVMATYIDAYQNDFRPSVIIRDAVLDGNQSYIHNFITSFREEDFLKTTEEWMFD